MLLSKINWHINVDEKTYLGSGEDKKGRSKLVEIFGRIEQLVLGWILESVDTSRCTSRTYEGTIFATPHLMLLK